MPRPDRKSAIVAPRYSGEPSTSRSADVLAVSGLAVSGLVSGLAVSGLFRSAAGAGAVGRRPGGGGGGGGVSQRGGVGGDLGGGGGRSRRGGGGGDGSRCLIAAGESVDAHARARGGPHVLPSRDEAARAITT